MTAEEALNGLISNINNPQTSAESRPDVLLSHAIEAITAHQFAENSYQRSVADRQIEYLKLLALLNIAVSLNKLEQNGLTTFSGE